MHATSWMVNQLGRQSGNKVIHARVSS